MNVLFQFLKKWYGATKEGRVRYRNFLVVSYPKSGRTWLRVMLDKLDIRLTYTHDIVGRLEEPFVLESSKYTNRKVILLVRNPIDVVVSYYFQMIRKNDKHGGAQCEGWSISKFIRNERVGIRSIINFYNEWSNIKHVPKDFLLVRYEDMHKNTVHVLDDALKFVGIKNISQELIQKVVKFSEFKNMQKLEKSGFFSKQYGFRLTPDDINDTNTYKVRRGVIGGYVDYLSREDIEYCKNEMRNSKCAFYEEAI